MIFVFYPSVLPLANDYPIFIPISCRVDNPSLDIDGKNKPHENIPFKASILTLS